MTQSSMQSPVTIHELPSQASRRLTRWAKLLIEKGLITREEFVQKIFRGTGDVPEAAESPATMNVAAVATAFYLT